MNLLNIIKLFINSFKSKSESTPHVTKVVTKESITYTIIIKRNVKT